MQLWPLHRLQMAPCSVSIRQVSLGKKSRRAAQQSTEFQKQAPTSHRLRPSSGVLAGVCTRVRPRSWLANPRAGQTTRGGLQRRFAPLGDQRVNDC